MKKFKIKPLYHFCLVFTGALVLYIWFLVACSFLSYNQIVNLTQPQLKGSNHGQEKSSQVDLDGKAGASRARQ